MDSIELEHELFSSYVEARHPYPDIVVSSLEPVKELIHSCHFVISATSSIQVTIVTYTEHGVRLSCTEFMPALYPLKDDQIYCGAGEHLSVGGLHKHEVLLLMHEQEYSERSLQ